MKFLPFAVIIFLFIPFQSHALDCPKIPEQTNKEWDVEVKAAVGKIGPVKGAELETRTKKAVRDLMGKLPQADKVYLEQMMYATYCSALRDDKTLSESEKASRIRAYNIEVRKTLFKKQGSLPEDKRMAARSQLADMECIQKEQGATIDRQPIPLSDWQGDCAYALPKELYGKSVTLTTWGIIIEYAGNTIVKVTIVPPRESFIVPSHSSLFAGYQSRDGANAAYMTANPNATKPSLYKKRL